MRSGRSKRVTIFLDHHNGGTELESIEMTGPNVSYVIDDETAPGCLKVWQGDLTLFFPLSRLHHFEFDVEESRD